MSEFAQVTCTLVGRDCSVSMQGASNERFSIEVFQGLMETKKLEHLIELAATGSFSRAAVNLHLTQSALSKSIQALEAELGTQLVERLGRRCTLTAAGESVVARARGVLPQIEALSAVARESAGTEGMLRVGFGAGPAASMTPGFIAHALSAYPRVRLLIRRGTPEYLLGALRDRSIDAIVIDARSLAIHEDLIMEPVGSLLGGIVCRAGHPLTRQSTIVYEDLLRFPIFNTAVSDEVTRWVQERYGQTMDVRRFVTVESEDIEPLIAAVACTDALFVGVTSAANEWIAMGKLTTIRIDPSIEVPVPVALVRLANKTEPKLVHVVRKFALDWFGRE